MNSRLTSQLLVTALLRRVQGEGGFGVVLHKGDPLSGTIVVQIVERGETVGLFERITNLDGAVTLSPCGPPDLTQDAGISQYIERRCQVDPDIWFVELDTAMGQRLAAEVLCAG